MYMAREGSFNGLLGFSQGVGLYAALARLQQQAQATAWWFLPVTTYFHVHILSSFTRVGRDSYSRGKHQGAGDRRQGV